MSNHTHSNCSDASPRRRRSSSGGVGNAYSPKQYGGPVSSPALFASFPFPFLWRTRWSGWHTGGCGDGLCVRVTCSPSRPNGPHVQVCGRPTIYSDDGQKFAVLPSSPPSCTSAPSVGFATCWTSIGTRRREPTPYQRVHVNVHNPQPPSQGAVGAASLSVGKPFADSSGRGARARRNRAS
jgi:hypothetical protein